MSGAKETVLFRYRFMIRLLWIYMILCVVFPAQAFFIETNAFYFSDTLAQTSATNSDTYMFIDSAVGFSVDKKDRFQVGWNYAMMNTSRSVSSTTTTYASTQMGPKFKYYLNKDRNLSISVAYNLVTSAAYSSGATSETWRGTSYHVDLGYTGWFSDSFAIGVKFNYASANYVETLTGGTNYTQVTNTRTNIYPSLNLILEF